MAEAYFRELVRITTTRVLGRKREGGWTEGEREVKLT